MILATDTYYFPDNTARTAVVAFHDWPDTAPASVHSAHFQEVAPYESGAFYKRELPCILHLLEQIDLSTVHIIVIDGYVVLDDAGKPGLGWYLYEALGQKIPVVGIAKTSFAHNQKHVVPVQRGESKQPLYVTAVGMPVNEAAGHLVKMAGPYRIPSLLTLVDQESRKPVE